MGTSRRDEMCELLVRAYSLRVAAENVWTWDDQTLRRLTRMVDLRVVYPPQP